MLAGESGQLVLPGTGRQGTNTASTTLCGGSWEAMGNGDYGMILRGTSQWLRTQVTKHALLNNSVH